MKRHRLSSDQHQAFWQHLAEEELAEGTIRKYRRDLAAFAAWADGGEITREVAAGWKEHLVRQGYAPVTINSMLAAVNAFFKFAGWHDCTVKFLKIQRRLFREQEKELTAAEFWRLVRAAEAEGQTRTGMLLETIASTGIRVSEVKYITVEAAKRGKTEIALKGKIRTILLPAKLCRKLLRYARESGITDGEIFRTRSGRGLSRKQIWAEMKRLCKRAGVAPGKVFPHNLRHLFAATFYQTTKDIVILADVLGHSSVETTRIYLLTTGVEHIRQLDRLGFVL